MTTTTRFQTLPASRSTALEARLGPTRALRYAHGANPVEDLPAHVRAASSIRRQGERLIIAQDDVSALALLDPATGATLPILLPAAPDGTRVFDDVRGNKKLKLDLEASILLPDGRFVAFGSGSSPHREKIVTVGAGERPFAQVMAGTDFYARLRQVASERGARLNVEGAVVQGGWLRLLQRGTAKRGFVAWNAILDVSLPAFVRWLDGRASMPEVQRVMEVDLGTIDGVPLGFTDAAVTVDGRLAFIACAEDTADAVDDGPVLGCCFGWIDADDLAASTTVVLDANGRPTTLKLEGIEARPGSSVLFDVVADMDRGEEAAQIAALSVTEG